MKHIKLFEQFVNESLYAGDKVKKSDIKMLIDLAKKDPEEFIEEFAQYYNSACELWMNENDIEKLAKLYASDEYKFISLSGETEDGFNDSKTETYINKNWILLASEQNHDNYDSILYKKK